MEPPMWYFISIPFWTVVNMESLMRIIVTVVTVIVCILPVFADYDCICNYNVEAGVFQTARSEGQQPIGYLYEFDCKPKFGDKNGNFYGIMYEKQVGYVEINAMVQLQTCPGEIPVEDKLTTIAVQTPTITSTMSETSQPITVPTTTSTTTTTTPTPPTTRTTRPTTPTLPITVPTTSTPATTLPTAGSTASTNVLEGHINLCPDYIKNTDVNRFHGFLGQYGEFCYELVDTPTQWVLAERHCKLVSSGSLVHILSQNEQDYIVKFLSNHSYVQTIWLGLTDSGFVGGQTIPADEGKYLWSSGAPYKYNNFGANFTSHSQHEHDLYDCAVMKQGGEWTDVSCGVALVLGLGAGESHPYICQYNISSSLPSIVDAFPHAIVG